MTSKRCAILRGVVAWELRRVTGVLFHGKGVPNLCNIVRSEWSTWKLAWGTVGLKASDVFYPSERAFRYLQLRLSSGEEKLGDSPGYGVCAAQTWSGTSTQ